MADKTIYNELARIQKALNVPKNQRNNFGNYNYRSCEDILEEVKKHLNGLVVTISDEIVQIGERYYVKATASLLDGVSLISTSAYAREEENKKGMDGAQVTGAASSYARKYALNGLFAIDDEKDADTKDNTDKVAQFDKAVAQQEAKPTKLCEGHGVQMQQYTNKAGAKFFSHKLENGAWCSGKALEAI